MQVELKLKLEDDAEPEVLRFLATQPAARLIKKHPVQRLPLQLLPLRPGRLLEVPDQYSVRVEYEVT